MRRPGGAVSALGLGRYDDICQWAAWATDASAIVVLVIGGNKGSDVSIGALDRQFLERLPGLLRFVSDDLKQKLEAS